MTNEEMLGVADIVERATNRFNAQAALYRERFDEHVKLIASIKADHEAKMVEHRAAFGARTEADAKIIAGLREESAKYKAESDHFDQREGIEQKRRMDAESERDALRAEVAALKSQTPNQHGRWVRATSEKCTHAKAGEVVSVRGYLVRTNSGEFLWEGKDCEPCDPPQTAPVPKRAHPVAVGEYLRRLTGFSTTPAGEVAQVLHVDCDAPTTEYTVKRPNGQQGVWSESGCEPCDPPATHDTEAGKAVAESSLKTEPVAEEIKVGDVVEVVSNTGLNTWLADVGSVGTVTSIETLEDSLSVRLKAVPDKKNVCGGYVSICDVRKVTT